MSFVTYPTKRCMPLLFIRNTNTAIERVAQLRLADALELGAPCSFSFCRSGSLRISQQWFATATLESVAQRLGSSLANAFLTFD